MWQYYLVEGFINSTLVKIDFNSGDYGNVNEFMLELCHVDFEITRWGWIKGASVALERMPATERTSRGLDDPEEGEEKEDGELDDIIKTLEIEVIESDSTPPVSPVPRRPMGSGGKVLPKGVVGPGLMKSLEGK